MAAYQMHLPTAAHLRQPRNRTKVRLDRETTLRSPRHPQAEKQFDSLKVTRRFFRTVRTAILASISFAFIGCDRAAPPPAVSGGVTEPISDAPVRTLVEEPPPGMKSSQDKQESAEVLQFITEHYSSTPPPKLYCEGGSISTHIHVYGITMPAEQDRIVELVRAEFPKRKWKPIYILFRDREHFTAQDNGWSKRDGEKQLYSIVIGKQ